MSAQKEGLAKVTWEDPDSGQIREFVLEEGATATIGRSPDNQIAIPERHVSRQHAVISFRDGIFMISDRPVPTGARRHHPPVCACP
jgi:predicted component of type VI protein secretion system